MLMLPSSLTTHRLISVVDNAAAETRKVVEKAAAQVILIVPRSLLEQCVAKEVNTAIKRMIKTLPGTSG